MQLILFMILYIKILNNLKNLYKKNINKIPSMTQKNSIQKLTNLRKKKIMIIMIVICF